jgi:hypothetical protein
MIHLIGVEHKVQCKNPQWSVTQTHRDDWDRYSSIIERYLCEIQPSVVAEEYSEELLAKKNRAVSILKNLSEVHQTHTRRMVEHIFVEPDLAVQSAKGCKTEEQVEAILTTQLHAKPSRGQIMSHMIAHQHPIRERLWFEQIKKHLGSEILFVCGDLHLYTFRRFLREKGAHCRIAERGIGVDASCLSDYEGLKLAIENQMCSDSRCFCQQPTQGC